MKLNEYYEKRNISGDYIKEYREKQKLSREDLSNKLALWGITLYQSDIYKIETNKRTIRDYELFTICEILQIPIEEIKEKIIQKYS